MTARIWKWPGQAAVAVCIGVVRVYQRVLSPLFGQACRFHPSCSNYMIAALRKYGLIRGLLKGCYRIMRCNPWNPGGIDLP